jgi:hypothetical protein
MSRNISLAEHLTLSNSVRGVVVFDPETPPDTRFYSWLAENHEFRNIGIPTSLADKTAIDVDASNTFIHLNLPTESLTHLRKTVADDTNDWLTEALLLSSAYLAPVLIDPTTLPHCRQYCQWQLKTVQQLPERQVLRHIRQLEHGMVDLFQESTQNGWNAFQRGNIYEEITRRQTIARTDGRDRCWRLIENADLPRETWVGGYFDILSAIADIPASSLESEASIGFGLVGGFRIDVPFES